MRKLVLGSFFLLAGCGSDPGAIKIQWDIGLSGSCEDADIVNVRITLEGEDTTLNPGTAPCSAGADGFTVDDVDEDSYIIKLEGLDAEGNVVYTGQSPSRVNVSEGKTASPPAIVMSPAPASLTIQWKFENGLGCPVQEGAPTDVELVLSKSNSVQDPQTVDCNLSQYKFEDLEADDDYDVRVTAQDTSRQALFRFEVLDIQLADGQQETRLGEFLACADLPDGCP